ncbi:MAG TPA: hypothetical protein VKI44_12900 [Acetobacteraceae bacterium]|nr:hypothetical protein [Acetobacteraceae bacterium]
MNASSTSAASSTPDMAENSPAEVTRPPLLGEHRAEVLEALCGVNADEVRNLRSQGVV